MKKIKENIKINKKTARKNYSNQTGITLIALVVTIVVLLILAGVSINALFGNSGIIEKAKDAQNRMNNAQESDLNALNDLDKWINNQVNGTTGGDDNPPTSDLPSVANKTIPYYPDNTFTKVEGTDLSNGLVIKDTSGNEYVWIEVPKTAEVYPTAGLKITNFTVDEYTAIERDLHTYTNYYRNGTSFTDEYPSDKVLAGTGLDSDAYTALKQKMLKSVYKNGGFWIGRYEAGIEKNRTSKDEEITAAPLSKAGTVENAVYPYTYVTCSQAQALASKLSTGKSYTSSLMFGVQWDLVLKHIETKIGSSNLTTSDGKNILTQDSSSWGNYNSSSAKQSGSSETYKKMNIYDLAGNVWEWTLEYTADSYAPCADRGGNFCNAGSGSPASYRFGSLTTYSYSSFGFRPSLYK